jgi:phosphatidylglycerophosphate synthase
MVSRFCNHFEYLSEIKWGLPVFLGFYSFSVFMNISCQTFDYFSLHGMILMQIFDAVDGKQARRTNSSSPLGELFAHGNLHLKLKLVDSVL